MLQAAASRLDAVLTTPDATIAAAMAQLDRAGTGVLVLVDEHRRLCGVVSDGDVRRAILAGTTLDTACGEIATRTPLVVAPTIAPAEALRLMDNARGSFVNNLVVVNDDGGVVGLLLRKDLAPDEWPTLSAMIMAGGFGSRLLPLTASTPKPMLPVGDRPLLEVTIASMRRAGIRRVRVSTHHLAERITEHFGDGSRFGIDLSYVAEDSPLGTAGALRLLPTLDEPLLVINGDILTGVHFDDMLTFHREQRAELTVAVRHCELQVPYGVLDCDGGYVRDVREKPRQQYFVNAGIYLLQPSVRDLIPPQGRFDMTDVIRALIDAGRPVASFPVVEYWLDIGQRTDYERAQADVRSGLVGA